jgi:tRNA G18 (ribose-2'-O)-methylase SpoU
MKFKPGISEHNFMVLPEPKQKQLLFLLLKEIESSDHDNLPFLKDELLRLIALTDMSSFSAQISSYESKEQIISLLFPHFSEEFHSEKDFHFKTKLQIKNKDDEENKITKPVILILHNLRSAFNVGSIIRTAECFGIEELIFSGYSPTPEHPKVKQTAMGTSEKIKWSYSSDIFQTIRTLKDNDYHIFALETASPSVKLNELNFSGKCAVILGNEALGIDKNLLEIADTILEIPVFGWKNSLNVATATAICCYELTKS